MTRRQQYIKDDRQIPYPPLESGAYLLGYLYEVGPIPKGEELTHEELAHWQRNIGLSLQPWEVRTLHGLSREYLAQSHKSADINCPAPFGVIERPANLNQLIDEVFG